MFASYLIIAAVLTLIAGHLALVNRMFMRSEQCDFSAPAQGEKKRDLPPIAAAQDCPRFATAA